MKITLKISCFHILKFKSLFVKIVYITIIEYKQGNRGDMRKNPRDTAAFRG